MSKDNKSPNKRLEQRQFSIDLSDELFPDLPDLSDIDVEISQNLDMELFHSEIQKSGTKHPKDTKRKKSKFQFSHEQRQSAPQTERGAGIEPADEPRPRSHREADSPPDDLSLVERAKFHARMRRREQTRQRRENAKRGIRPTDSPYQAITPIAIRTTLIRLAFSAILMILGVVLQQNDTVSFTCYVLAYLSAVTPVIITIARNITHKHYFDEYLLIFIASLGAFLLKHHPEASFVLILHSVGKLICDMVLASTHESSNQQAEFIPAPASVVNMQGEERHLEPTEIAIGDFVMIRSGERIPIDGEVLRGDGEVNQEILTGDSEPVPVAKGSKVLAGSIYTGSLMLVRAAAKFEDCAICRIQRIREQSADYHSDLEDSVTHGLSHYIPIFIVAAVLISVLPPLFNFGEISGWTYRALTALIAFCPTALTISVPLSFMGGSNRLAQKGVQIKGSETIERLAELRMVVFGKTGTLTEGNLRIKQILPSGDFKEEGCLALAATAEQMSEHPVARAIVAAYEGPPQKITDFEEYPGRGVRARIGRHNLLVGNRKLMVSRGVKGVPDLGGTVVYVAYEGDYAGAVVLEDTIRPEAAAAVSGLKAQGVVRTVILTGDTEVPTQVTADTVGVDTIHSGLTPDEKASKLEFLLRTIPTDGTTAYVGDGLSDLAELKLADIGVSIGPSGSKESADAASILIISNDLRRLTDAVRISHLTHGVAMQNMILLLGVKIILVALTLFGITTMWQAMAIDVLLTVLAVLNSARVQKAK